MTTRKTGCVYRIVIYLFRLTETIYVRVPWFSYTFSSVAILSLFSGASDPYVCHHGSLPPPLFRCPPAQTRMQSYCFSPHAPNIFERKINFYHFLFAKPLYISEIKMCKIMLINVKSQKLRGK